MFREIKTDTYFDYYTIKNGDTLYKISKNYNINPQLLAALNGIDMDDYIYAGQVLLIPNKNYSYYITKEGDTLSGVADTFDENITKIIDDNKTIYLQSGQMIIKKKG